jgi:hypothetical protein
MGFEYQPLRQRPTIAPGQRELRSCAERPDWRHTLDDRRHACPLHLPQTAWLQVRRGVEPDQPVASQRGDLYTNVGDIRAPVWREP